MTDLAQFLRGRTNRVTAVFSDIDGTVVHYEKTLAGQGYTKLSETDATDALGRTTAVFYHSTSGRSVECYSVPSMTLGGGYISKTTLSLVEQMRREFGVLFVLLTGARTSTLVARRNARAIPETDHDVCEGGGKIYTRSSNSSSSNAFDSNTPDERVPYSVDVHQALYAQDDEWLDAFAATTGPWQQLDAPPAARVGPLWDVYRQLESEGFKLDCRSFSTAFLLDLRHGRKLPSDTNTGADADYLDAERALLTRFAECFTPRQGVAMHTNLGKAHIAPVGCNKRTAVERLLKLHGLVAAESVALFDDQNDLEFAELCAAGFVPGIAHPEVERALAADAQGERRFCSTPVGGLLGTDDALAAIICVLRNK